MRLLALVFLYSQLSSVGSAGMTMITGNLADPSGAAIPGVTVQLLVSGRTIARTETNVAGEFTLTPEGNALRSVGGDDLLVVAAEATGFAPASQSGRLSDLTGRRLSVVMEIAPYRQSIEVAGALPLFKSVLDMSGVRESAAKDVGEALTQLDGVWKIRKAGIANDLVIRGFQQNNINVLVDGSRTYGACPGHMDPPAQHVDFAQVEQVELIKGAFDVSHQGSLGAVVNVITKSPAQGFSLKPSFSAGSFGYYNPSIVGSYGNRTVRFLAGYSYRISEPYKDGSGKPVTDYAAYSAAGKKQNSFDINTAWVETQFSLSGRQQVAFSYSRQQAGLILYPYLTMDSDYDNADRGMVRYTAKDLSQSLRAVRVETYFTQVKHFMSNSQRAGAMNGVWNMASDASTRAIGGRIETDLGRDLTFGAESYYRNWNVIGFMQMGMMMTRNPSIPNVDTQTVGSFLDYRHVFSDRLRISGGVRFDHAASRVTAANTNTDLYYQFQNTRRTSNMDNYPSGNIRLSAGLTESTEFFAGVGSTGRIPDAAERYFRRGMGAGATVGNPLLPITRNTEATSGLNVNRGRFYFRPAFFYSFLNDYILVNNQPQWNAVGMGSAMVMPTARSYTNVGARIYGGEAGYGASLTSTLSVSGGTSYSRGTATPKPAANVLSPYLPEIPPLRSWAAVRYTRQWTFAEVGAVAANRQERVSKDLNEMPTAGYALFNLKLGFTYRKLSGSFGIDNLLNRYYFEYLSYYRDPFSAGVRIPEPGRQFFAQLRYVF